MRSAFAIISLMFTLFSIQAHAYTQELNCQTLKGPEIRYQGKGELSDLTFIVFGEFLDKENKKIQWRVVGLNSPSRTYSVNALLQDQVQSVLLTNPQVQFLSEPSYAVTLNPILINGMNNECCYGKA